MNIQKESFGLTREGLQVSRYILSNDDGMEVHLTDYGANIIKIIVEDKEGQLDDIALGYDNVSDYEDNDPGFGSFIGRHANRIKDGSFELNNVIYNLEKNDGNNNLHGGSIGYNNLVYDIATFKVEDTVSIEFSRTSPNMEQGFPGNLDIKVRYTITKDNSLIIDYYAVSDQDTVVNLTNHSYFNLSGHNSGSILDHKVWIKSDSFTLTDNELIPTGEVADLTDTPMDFRELKALGRDIEADYEPLLFAGGYDHNYILKKETKQVEKVASLVDDKTSRVMDVYTDLPGMQLYTGNFIDNERGKEGVIYNKRDGVCFETQYYPNSINIAEFPSCILKAGEEFKSTTIYKFSIKE
ncbi:MAG TPA: galactose mutarotase [Clostridiales bacterium]|nr:galactose mutarotase [Clostridiales bacterium]